MPMYDYMCEDCGKREEEDRKVKDRDKPLKKKCECGGRLLRLVTINNNHRWRYNDE